MKDAPHPLGILIAVVILGVFGWPWLKYHKIMPSGLLYEGLAAFALMGTYYFYKSWYDKQKKG